MRRRGFPPATRGGWILGLFVSSVLAVPCAVQAGASQLVAVAPVRLAQGRPGDAGSVVTRARAALARGRYDEAEALLAPVASRTPNSDAALELGLLLQMLGRTAEATRLFEQVLNAPPVRPQAADFARVGRAAQALGEFQAANNAFRDAASLAPNDPAVNTAWGDLFLRAHNNQEAAKSFRDAMAADPKSVPAQLGLAHALADDNPPEAMVLAKRVLSIDPASVPAHLFIAELELDRSNREDAKTLVAKALEINPASLEAHALRGAIAYVEGRQEDFQAALAAALKINPRYGEAYRVAGGLAARNYRFEEAVTLTRQGVALDAGSARAHAELGMHLMRTGDEAQARQELERSFRVDPYDVSTYNLLNLLDTLDKFETSREGSIVLRLDQSEVAVMRESVGLLANRALTALSARYEFAPRLPVLVEIFPRHDDFAVRTVGLPGMSGALGACFGRVVTMDSPKARPSGSFHWAATLWHELAHVITLQLSQQRVPRWLTEGISVFEEQRASPAWAREMDVTFAQLYGRGEILSLRELNAAFTNPEKISLAYYEASLVVEYIVDRYGTAAVRKLLVTYGQGLEGEAALREGLGADFDTLQKGFTEMLDKRFSSIAKALEPPPELAKLSPELLDAQIEKIAAANPGSFPAQLTLGDMLSRVGRTDEAFHALERAAELVPMATGPESPHAMMARMALEKGDRTRAIRELEALLKYAHTDIEAARQLVKLLEAAGGTPSQLTAAYDRVSGLDPFDAGAHAGLGRLALQRQDGRTAAREFRAALAAGPLDPAAAHCDLAESYLMSGDREQAKRQTLLALEIAPSYERAQDLLLKLVEAPQ